MPFALPAPPSPAMPSFAPCPTGIRPYCHPRAPLDGTESPPRQDWWRRHGQLREPLSDARCPWRPGYRIAWLQTELIADTSIRDAETPWRECPTAARSRVPCPACVSARLRPNRAVPLDPTCARRMETRAAVLPATRRRNVQTESSTRRAP